MTQNGTAYAGRILDSTVTSDSTVALSTQFGVPPH